MMVHFKIRGWSINKLGFVHEGARIQLVDIQLPSRPLQIRRVVLLFNQT